MPYSKEAVCRIMDERLWCLPPCYWQWTPESWAYLRGPYEIKSAGFQDWVPEVREMEGVGWSCCSGAQEEALGSAAWGSVGRRELMASEFTAQKQGA